MDQLPVFKKTRIAPTPSGFLHLGNIFSFAMTAALAAKTQAKILLRIDDFDRERTNRLYIQDIFDTLNFLQIPWHEGPKNMHEYETEYSQVHRTDIYKNALQELRDKGAVFACACTRTQVVTAGADSVYQGTCRDKHISLDAPHTSWRINTAQAQEIEVKTLTGTVTTALPAPMHDFMVRKKDGLPAYQLTSVLDDVYYGVDLVVRGEDLWPSSLAQLYLARALGLGSFMDATFYHHPLLVNAEGKKLSKSDHDTPVQELRKQHKKPADIYTMIARLIHADATADSWQELASIAAPALF